MLDVIFSMVGIDWLSSTATTNSADMAILPAVSICAARIECAPLLRLMSVVKVVPVA